MEIEIYDKAEKGFELLKKFEKVNLEFRCYSDGKIIVYTTNLDNGHIENSIQEEINRLLMRVVDEES